LTRRVDSSFYLWYKFFSLLVHLNQNRNKIHDLLDELNNDEAGKKLN